MKGANPWLVIASISGLVAVGAGAYGAHDLSTEDTFQDSFNSGVQYHMWHSLALLAVAWFTEQRQGTNAAKWGHLAGGLFVAGIVLFSGTLYYLGVSGELFLSGVAPVGGMALMAGWAVLAFAASRTG
ncbi:MAG: DUF423 domain-containing protein [Proteobacteria bacterium]|nr:DUF423 domain-containing protein [Pseudomonadota bacterium]